ncbi:MAG: IS21 family transposase [Chloroflexi bacterium]|nr:IS21 family transposase [Chloroflexota bacterium]
MLRGGQVQELFAQQREGVSIREIATRLGLARNTVRKYLRAPGVPVGAPRAARLSKAQPFSGYIRERLAAGVANVVVLLREVRALGYTGSYPTLVRFVRPLRPMRPPAATRRFETAPGKQAQVDFGTFTYRTVDGRTRSIQGVVMVLSWSRAAYVEFIERADVATFLRCHFHAFAALGIPRRCLYDNAKVVVLDRDQHDQPIWNERFLDFALRLGFDPQLCRRYRAQTKGRVESGIKYVKHNFWPNARFTDLDDLNRQARHWTHTIADQRIHGTTAERPADRLIRERPCLRSLPPVQTLAVFERDDRRVGRDGFIRWQRSSYGVKWTWAAKTVQVGSRDGVIEIWAGTERLVVHARATAPGQRFTAPGQWDGMPVIDGRRRHSPLARQLQPDSVEQRPLATYAALLGEVAP